MEKPVITVQGNGEIFAKPDKININISTSIKDMKYSKLLEKAGEGLDKMQKALAKTGIPKDALKTVNLNTYPGSGSIFQSSSCTHSMKLEIDYDMELAENITEALSESGVSHGVNISFDRKNKDVLEEKIFEESFADAKRKAERLARVAGVKLGKIVNIQQGKQTDYMLAGTLAYSEDLAKGRRHIEELTPADIRVSDEIHVTWVLE